MKEAKRERNKIKGQIERIKQGHIDQMISLNQKERETIEIIKDLQRMMMSREQKKKPKNN